MSAHFDKLSSFGAEKNVAASGVSSATTSDTRTFATGSILRIDFIVVIAVFALLAGLLLTTTTNNFPDLHGILDTTAWLLTAMLAGLLWDIGLRTSTPVIRWLGLGFAVTSILELFHALTAIPWRGFSGSILLKASLLRPSSWSPATYLLPISILAALGLARQARAALVLFVGSLVILGAGLLVLFSRIPAYAPDSWLGVPRPSLLPVPFLWLAVGVACWLRRGSDRVFPALTMMTVLMVTAHTAMLFSELQHDTMVMVAHFGKDLSLLFLLVYLMQMGTMDMQQLIATEQALRRSNNELKAASNFKSDFLANMSHELRTPLNGIIGFSEFLIDGKEGPINSQQSECLSHVLKSGRHLLQLINDVLDLSKVEAGKMEFHPETFSVRDAIEEACSAVAPMAQKKNLVIRREVNPAVAQVTLDAQKFAQVLLNLLSNAVKFTHDGGRVDITAEPLDQAWFRLRVRDEGIGIKPEDMDKLFLEFHQLDSSAARRRQGTGLGLALTKRIVEFQQGTIQAESEPGKGSTFTVVLPCSGKKATA